jgi:hypothetical protein
VATITQVYPSYAKAGDSAIKVIGTGFQDAPSKTKVYHRKHSQTAWENVDPTRVTYVSATELTIAIDAANTDGWDNGLNDVGVSDSGETTPDGSVAQALFFYVAGAFSPDDVIKGAVEELYIEGLFMGHTHGSLDIEHGVETSEIEVDQSLLPVRTIKAGETFSLAVPLAEVTLEHIKEVWGISASIEELGAGRGRRPRRYSCTRRRGRRDCRRRSRRPGARLRAGVPEEEPDVPGRVLRPACRSPKPGGRPDRPRVLGLVCRGRLGADR